MKKLVCIVLSFIMIAAAIPFTASAAIIVPRIVETVYPTEDVVIADIVITQPPYNADNSGVADCTDIINKAIRDCADNGGGTVFLPVGKYRITGNIDILPYVSLRGDWADPTIYGNKYGTVIIADVPSSDEFQPELFTVGGSGGATGLTVYYPEQSLDNVKPYPYTFYIDGWGANYMQQSVVNVTMINTYRGIGACAVTRNEVYECHELLTVENVYMTALCEGIASYNSADVDIYKSVTVSPDIWAQAGEEYNAPDKAALAAYTRANAVGLLLGDLEWPQFADIYISDCNYGMLFDEGIRASFSAVYYNLTIENCNYGYCAPEDTIMVRDKSWGIAIANSSISGSEMAIEDMGKSATLLTDVEINGKVRARNIKTDNYTQLDEFVVDYDKTYTKPAANLVTVIADRTGRADASGFIQAALNLLRDSGGVCYVPAGIYRLDNPLTVPAGVELRGSGSLSVREQNNGLGGTLLLAYYGYEEGDEPLITLSGDKAGMNAVKVLHLLNYPTSAENNFIPTSPAVSVEADDCYVVNSNITLSSTGIKVSNADNFFAKKVIGCCYNSAISVTDSKNAWIEGCLQNATCIVRNNFSATQVPELQNLMTEADIFTFIFEPLLRPNCDYLTFVNAENATVLNTFIYGGRCFADSTNSDILIVNIGCDGQGKTKPMFSFKGGKVTAIGTMQSSSDGRTGFGLAYETDGNTELRLYSRLAVDMLYKIPNVTENVEYEGTDAIIFGALNLLAKITTFFGDLLTRIDQL